jgi:NADH:ubiquinone oxidoreductase subunit H
MAFALFFLAEYANMILIAALASTLFLGGWLPILDHRSYAIFQASSGYLPKPFSYSPVLFGYVPPCHATAMTRLCVWVGKFLSP